MSLLLKNIGRIYTPLSSAEYGLIEQIEHVHLFIVNGIIAAIIKDGEKCPPADIEVDAAAKTVLPGFVDAHTHPVFWKTREDEFIMRVQGRSYEEIARAGGGIRHSARRFREASKAAIKEISKSRISTFLQFGTTTIEAKSGYGLSLEDEIKSLEIIGELNEEQPLQMVPTFLGAHEIPDNYQHNRRGYIDLIIKEMLPHIAEHKLAEFCDVFCERGVFTVEESREILQAAATLGLKSRIHADELSAFGGAELAAEIKAVSADHLVKASDQGIAAMARQGVIAILLPGTTFFLGKDQYAPARKIIEAGCRVAVATDFNPGSSTTQNIQLMWTIAAMYMRLLPNELLWATTLTAAQSLCLQDQIGSIEVGKQADLVILDIPNLNYLPYHYGVNHTWMTIKKGKVVYQRQAD